jgi:hypothetical protein
MNKYLKKIFFILSIINLTACNNELEITANYESQAFVYCVLDQDDSVHYIRLERSFQIDENIDDLDNLEDSIYFSSSDVKILRVNGNNVIQTIQFQENNNFPKEDGFFPSNNHIVYSSSEELVDNGKYKLLININELEQEISGETVLFSDVRLKEEYYSPLFKLNFTLSTPQKITWYTNDLVRAYDIFFRFHYKEIHITDTSDKYFDMPIRTISNNPFMNYGEIDIDIPSSTFYGQISSNININSEVRRIFESIEIGFNLYSKELYSFIEISSNINNNGLILSEFDNDNIVNGTGIFANKKTTLISGFEITNRSIDSLSCGIITKSLNFADHQGTYYCLNSNN